MTRASIRSWWLLAICILEIAIAALFFRNTSHGFVFHRTVELIGRLALAAGACTIAAAVRAAPRNWLLLIDGLAIGFLGLALSGVFGPRITFRLIALLMFVNALGLSLDLWRRRGPILIAACIIALFGLAFGVMTITGLRPAAGSNPEMLLFGSYFACHALSLLGMLWMSLRD